MEIGFIYSSKDPRQVQARDFVKKFVNERGVLAKIIESEQPVKSPTVIVNGRALKDQRRKPRSKDAPMYPTTSDIANFLERYLWSV
ncbi:MAG: hypothetical protein ACE5K8_08850 [Candidatus Zixiibacteriota bacterium]